MGVKILTPINGPVVSSAFYTPLKNNATNASMDRYRLLVAVELLKDWCSYKWLV